MHSVLSGDDGLFRFFQVSFCSLDGCQVLLVVSANLLDLFVRCDAGRIHEVAVESRISAAGDDDASVWEYAYEVECTILIDVLYDAKVVRNCRRMRCRPFSFF